MGLSTKIFRTILIVSASTVVGSAFVIWVARPPRIYIDVLQLANPSRDAPVRLIRAWANGHLAPRTPAGFFTLFEPTDLMVAAALLFVLAVLLILLGMTWSWPVILSRAAAPVRIPWPPPLSFRVRGGLIAIAILGLYLGWETVGWETWRLRQRLRPILASCGERLALHRRALEEYRANLSHLQSPSESRPGDVRTNEARESERAWNRDHLLRQIAHAERMIDHFARLKTKYERAVAHPRVRVEPDPPAPELEHEFYRWVSERNYSRALAAYDAAILRYPGLVEAHRDRAWILAACSDPRYRDGKAAVASAARACELTTWQDPYVLKALAAAHAEAGDFQSAVEWEKRSLERARLLGYPARPDENKYLVLYSSGKPYREGR